MINALLSASGNGPIIVVLVLIAIAIIILIANIKIVPQATAQIVERLGSYKQTWTTGIHFKIPFIEVIAKKLTLMAPAFLPLQTFVLRLRSR